MPTVNMTPARKTPLHMRYDTEATEQIARQKDGPLDVKLVVYAVDFDKYKPHAKHSTLADVGDAVCAGPEPLVNARMENGALDADDVRIKQVPCGVDFGLLICTEDGALVCMIDARSITEDGVDGVIALDVQWDDSRKKIVRLRAA